MSSQYNKYNFYKHTFCVFEQVTLPSNKRRQIDYISKSGSKYIFAELGVYRISNHWGRAANCRWRLQSTQPSVNQNESVGFAKWTDFFLNDETSKLFFIMADVRLKEVTFFHKNSNLYDQKAILRNASQTAKTIQNIKLIFNETSWSKHLIYNDFYLMQSEIITALIYSDKSFLEIKRAYL